MTTFRQLWAIFVDTLREAASRKVFIGMTLSGALSAGMLYWLVHTITRQSPHSTLTVLQQSDPRLLDTAFLAKNVLASVAPLAMWCQAGFSMALLAGLVAPLLSTQRNALVVAAPVPRLLILIGRYFGLISIASVGVFVTFVALWIAVSMKFGVWHWPFLLGFGSTCVVVAALLALLMLVHGAVGSPAVSIVVITGLCMLAVGAQSPERVRDITGSAFVADLAVFLGKILPRAQEIAHSTAAYIGTGAFGDTSPLWFTAAGAVVFAVGAGSLFARREF